MPVLVERRDDRQAERLAELEVLGAAARARCGRCRCPRPRRPRSRPRPGARTPSGRRCRPRTPSGRPAGRRTGPRSASRPGRRRRRSSRDLERPDERRLAACPCRARTGRRPGGRGRSAAPGRPPPRRSRSASRASSSRPAAPRPAGRAAGSRTVSPGSSLVLVALVHLHLREAGPAARAPRHRVVALVQPAAPVALGQEAPDQVVVLVAEREVASRRPRASRAARRASRRCR